MITLIGAVLCLWAAGAALYVFVNAGAGVLEDPRSLPAFIGLVICGTALVVFAQANFATGVGLWVLGIAIGNCSRLFKR